MKRDKKLDELLIMRHFIEKYPDFPKGKLVQHESPDFIYKVNRRKNINIELTEILFSKSNPSPDVLEITSQINLAIIKKNEKLRLYNVKKPFQNWLIIYCESFALKKDSNLAEEFRRTLTNSRFDKTFVFDLFSGFVIDLSEE